jgi:pyridoxal phosphate enzyme (YggS family)
MQPEIAINLETVRKRMAAAATRTGRDAEEVTLVAVTKTLGPEVIRQTAALGLTDFGENRVQEAEEKIPLLKREGLEITWHMVGHVQRNKVKKALELFDMIHSIDSLHLAREIDKRANQTGSRIPVLLEVNTSQEATKHGFRLDEGEVFFSTVGEILDLPHLRVQGLMTMAPVVTDSEEARPCFRLLRQMLGELKGRLPQGNWTHLSMGMTDDFEVAIEEGATILRIGRAIFGERKG